ncbi:dihydroorotase [Cryomorpha ignava]|uniref:Dihydroorotase n=1 Tax=Cryomorpha ignava TaxID=101383 RepID=A0A7K3WTD1_9FLAO|nr:dihydroorotase [Cryomorpha ignava]NEN24940.1 dihydroorotase [Cryomorpha ignava]
MAKYLIKGAKIVNEGTQKIADVLITDGLIQKIASEIEAPAHCEIIHAEGLHLLPGLIDDQVHFREPGFTHKGDIETESRAAVAGGVTSFMEMPNTVPNTLTQELLEEKYQRAAEVSRANYSFFMGASNDNLDEVVKTDPKRVCGVKVFMGSSTGNMLVDNQTALENLFKESPTIVASHCEDEQTIRENIAHYKSRYGEDVPMWAHPLIRSAEACYRSSSRAIELATKFNARLHILHISTERETMLCSNDIPLEEKRITAEACTHHLWFTDADYETKGSLIKWNPAVKTYEDRNAIRAAVNSNRIDVIATDHAPHTLEEKQNSYFKAPSGGPLVQHTLPALLDLYHTGVFTLEKIVEKTSHSVARLFEIENRGFIREGFAADLVLVDLDSRNEVLKSNLLYKCGWSPFEGHTFKSAVKYTFVNGEVAFKNGAVIDSIRGKRLSFKR